MDTVENNIFSRTELLLGDGAIKTLESKHVILFGLGGVGSYTAEALARCAVGELTLVDNDTLCETNRNRQLYALGSTMGELKTHVAAQRIADINPACRVHEISEFYLPENANGFFGVHYDCIGDAIDTVSAKIDLAVKAQQMNIPIVSCMGTGNKLDATLFTVSDIYKTQNCPLCRVMRRELKKRGVESLRAVWSPEMPTNAVVSDVSDRHAPGSVSFVPPVAGMILAGEIIKILLGGKDAQ